MNLPKGPSLRDEERVLRTKRIREDIAKRLRRACSYLSDEDFAALVDKMTNTQLHFEGRSR